jgi:fatty acid synthase
MGLTAVPSIATKVASPPECLWDVPQGWSLGQAATVPCAYSTA